MTEENHEVIQGDVGRERWWEDIDREVTVVDAETFQKILDLIDNPPEPNEHLKALMRRAREGFNWHEEQSTTNTTSGD